MLPDLLLALALTNGMPHGAPAANERWTATSTAAESITGDVRIQPGRIVFANGASIPIGKVRTVTFTDELGAVGQGTMYRVLTGADPVLLHGNRICGGPGASARITYVVLVKTKPVVPGEGSGRALAAYSTRTEPAPNASNVCAILRYDPAK